MERLGGTQISKRTRVLTLHELGSRATRIPSASVRNRILTAASFLPLVLFMVLSLCRTELLKITACAPCAFVQAKFLLPADVPAQGLDPGGLR